MGGFSFFGGNDVGGDENMTVNRHITGTAHQGGNFTAGKIPTTPLLFLVFEQSYRHHASYPQVDGAQHTSSIEHIAAALAQERSVGRGTGGWCLGNRKAVSPETDTFFVADRF